MLVSANNAGSYSILVFPNNVIRMWSRIRLPGDDVHWVAGLIGISQIGSLEPEGAARKESANPLA